METNRATSTLQYLLIALLGLHNAGIVVASPATMVTVGNLTSLPCLLGLLGFFLICIFIRFFNRFFILVIQQLYDLQGFRQIAFANMPLALAEPVPLTLANLITKSFTARLGCILDPPRNRLS